jgi:isoquinoline 1-oxidoreductase beta subunit
MTAKQNAEAGISRREVVFTALTAAGGFALGFVSPGRALGAASLAAAGWDVADPDGASELSPWVVINPDDTVIIRVPHPEIGCGITTTLPQIMAEELCCDWSKVRAEFADPNRNQREKAVYGDMVLSASRGIMTNYKAVQQAGASARERLIVAAAQRWNVAPTECVAEASQILHKPSGRKIAFGALAADAATVKLAKEPPIKSPDKYTFIGTSPDRLDIPHKVDGAAKFAIDVRLPGMIYAAVAYPPVLGGKTVSVDDASVRGRRGIIKVVHTENLVAVIADSYWRAKEALKDLKISWNSGSGGGWDSARIYEKYLAMLDGPKQSCAMKATWRASSRRNPAPSLRAFTTSPTWRTPLWSH